MKNLVIGLGVLGFGAPAFATPILADSFVTGTNPAGGEYVAYDSTSSSPVFLRSQPSGLVTSGFVNGGYASGTGTSQFVASASGLDSNVSSIEAGGSVRYLPGLLDSAVRTNARNLTSPLNTSTTSVFYTSVMVQRGDKSTAAVPTGFVGVGFSNTLAPATATAGAVAGFLPGFYVGFSGATAGDASTNFGSLVIRSRNTTGQDATDTILVDGAAAPTLSQTYFLVIKSSVNVNGSIDTLQYWLNPANPESDATMTATAQLTGTISGYMYQGGTTDFTRVSFSSFNWDGAAAFDEIRVGTAVADVFVPEPSSMAVTGLVAAGLLRRRR